MKIKIILFTLISLVLSLALNTNISYADTVSVDIPLTGTVAEKPAYYGGKLVFPSDSVGTYTGVHIKPINTVLSDTGAIIGNLDITGNFWLSNLDSSSDHSLGWVTFDTSLSSKVVLKNNLNNTFTFSGFARSHAAGWIYFSPANLVFGNDNTRVVYNRGAGTVNGCAWSKNIGWICIDNFILDTTPPDLNGWTLLKPFAANHDKTIDKPNNDTNKIEIQNWDSASLGNSYTFPFQHDFRQVKNYDVNVIDTNGNISNRTIKVVAGVPTVTPDAIHKISSIATASNFSTTSAQGRKADNSDFHRINFELRDKYGNVVKNETDIKKIEVQIGFSNTVDIDQTTNNNPGSAIVYGSNDFGLISGVVSNSGTGSTTTGDYNINIKSKAPTSAGYSYTSPNNDIEVNNLKVIVTALPGNSGVGENNPAGANFTNNYNGNFKFTPVIKVDSISNNAPNNKFIRDVETTFTGSIAFTGSSSVADLNIQHKLDIMSGSTMNHRMSFQDIAGTNNTTNCVGYVKPNPDNTNSENSESLGCNNLTLSGTSYIIKNNIGPINNNFDDGFKATPKIVLATLPKFTIKYSSVVEYKLLPGNTTVKYPSLTQSFGEVINNEVKITGLVHKSENSFAVVDGSSINYIGKLDKTQMYTQIKKNISQYEKVGAGTYGSIAYFNATQNNISDSSFDPGIDTIIVNGGDVKITGDILKVSGNPKVIIALKNGTTGGNIWIEKDVQFVGATLIADRSVLSGAGNNNYYSDDSSAKKQLFIKGSVLSYNTIGGASSATAKCPFYITTCNLEIAKRYDLNHFRYFVNLVDGVSGYGVDMSKTGYANAPVIVEYDSEIQTKSPSILLTK